MTMRDFCAFSTVELGQDGQSQRRFVFIDMPDYYCVAAVASDSTDTSTAPNTELRTSPERREQLQQIWEKRSQDCVCHAKDFSDPDLHNRTSNSALVAYCQDAGEVLVVLPDALYRACIAIRSAGALISYENSSADSKQTLEKLARITWWEILVQLQERLPLLPIKLFGDGNPIALNKDFCTAMETFRLTQIPARRRANTIPRRESRFEYIYNHSYNTLPRSHRSQRSQ